jgi:hypothetical protein
VNQPISCYCPWQTVVFVGQLASDERPGNAADTVQVLFETGGRERRVSFLIPSRPSNPSDPAGASTICLLVSSAGTSFDARQECVDPNNVNAKVYVESGQWSRSASGDELKVTYTWTAGPGAPASRATFHGKAITLAPPPVLSPPVCHTRFLREHSAVARVDPPGGRPLAVVRN